MDIKPAINKTDDCNLNIRVIINATVGIESTYNLH